MLAGVEEDGCANEVEVSAISRSPSRQTAIILAQDSGVFFFLGVFPLQFKSSVLGFQLFSFTFVSLMPSFLWQLPLSVTQPIFPPLGSGDVLRCDVLVDAVHHLEIVTTTRELYEEEAPEAFEVQAYDSQGEEELVADLVPNRSMTIVRPNP